MVNIILCGGFGERLWPLSRTRYPKQFCKIINEKSLFQLTAIRNRNKCDRVLVVTNTEQYFLAKEQLEDEGIEDADFLLETISRNTAPAITLACCGLDIDELVLVTPSDHIISNTAEYEEVLEKGRKLANENKLCE